MSFPFFSIRLIWGCFDAELNHFKPTISHVFVLCCTHCECMLIRPLVVSKRETNLLKHTVKHTHIWRCKHSSCQSKPGHFSSPQSPRQHEIFAPQQQINTQCFCVWADHHIVSSPQPTRHSDIRFIFYLRICVWVFLYNKLLVWTDI